MSFFEKNAMGRPQGKSQFSRVVSELLHFIFVKILSSESATGCRHLFRLVCALFMIVQ